MLKTDNDAKLSSRAAAVLAQPIEVIVELRGAAMPESGTRTERIDKIRDEFDRTLRPVAARIVEAGGQVLRTAWINQTVHATVPVGDLESITALREVTRVDLPRPLRLAAGGAESHDPVSE